MPSPSEAPVLEPKRPPTKEERIIEFAKDVAEFREKHPGASDLRAYAVTEGGKEFGVMTYTGDDGKFRIATKDLLKGKLQEREVQVGIDPEKGEGEALYIYDAYSKKNGGKQGRLFIEAEFKAENGVVGQLKKVSFIGPQDPYGGPNPKTKSRAAEITEVIGDPENPTRPEREAIIRQTTLLPEKEKEKKKKEAE